MEMVTVHNQTDVLEDMITPLARTPYDAQIIFKDGIVRNFLKNLRTSGLVAYHVEIFPIEPSVSIKIKKIEAPNSGFSSIISKLHKQRSYNSTH